MKLQFIVTIKLPKNKNHNPQDKKIGQCPAFDGSGFCSDVTGEHHSYMQDADSPAQAAEFARLIGFSHVTRVEQVS